MRKRFFILPLLLLFLSGCGPKLAPVLAEYDIVTPSELAELQAGIPRPLFHERFTQPAWLTKLAVVPTAVSGRSLGPLPMGQVWVAWHRLADGTLVLSAPESYAPGLGLCVDNEGRVAGMRPWVDLKRGVRPDQPVWSERARSLFTPADGPVLDLFETSGVYLGMQGGEARLDVTRAKRPASSASPGAIEHLRLQAGQAVRSGPAVLTAVSISETSLGLAVAAQPLHEGPCEGEAAAR